MNANYQSNEGLRTVFIGNLAWTTTDADLKIFCSSVGKIVHSEIKRFPDTSRSKGWGLVEYETPAAAQAAVENLNMKEFMSRIVHIRFDRTVIDEADDANAIKVFVGNLPWDFLDNDLENYFRGYPPRKFRVMTNMAGRSRGFALLQYDTLNEAQAAIQAYNLTEIGGRQIQCRIDRGPGREVVKIQQHHHQPQQSMMTTLFVRNISPMCTENVLASIFSRFGTLSAVEVMIHPNGMPKGWGVVTYFSMTDALRALQQLNGRIVFNDMPPLEVRLDRKIR